MKFTWKAIVIAPLVVPFVYSAALELQAPSKSPILSFLIVFGFGSIFSLVVTLFLLFPALFLVARLTPLTAPLTAVVGTILGGIVYIPVIWETYLTSGDNSGPPQESFFSYLWQYGLGEDLLIFLVAGLVTSTLYWLLAKGSTKTL
jgi:hypothetical protein